ncbi:MAG: hypothetical protein K6T34_10885 [Thermoflavifilum sp.]|nr:hypothetical protein [Thermoflavifilum sp.]
MTTLPEDFLKTIAQLPGVDQQRFLSAHAQTPPVSIRLHPLKWKKWAADTSFTQYLPIATRVPWAEQGYYLREKPSFLFDPLFYAGAYYVQEASSMFVDVVMQHWKTQRSSTPALLLDLCAAPGGKSTLLLSHLQPNDLLISNETVPQRWLVLQENLIRWGYPQIILTQLEAHRFQAMPTPFDLVLVDAPCSGSGMFRKDQRMRKLWTPSSVQACSVKQQHLVRDIWPTLKPGGWLVYSTCSFSVEENEHVIDQLIHETHAEPVQLHIPDDWGIYVSYSPKYQAPGYRFYPDKLQGEGFFLSVLQKPIHSDQQAHTASFLKKNQVFTVHTLAPDEVLKTYIDAHTDLSLIQHRDLIYAFPTAHLPLLHHMGLRIPIRQAGLCVGKMYREWTPDHGLSMLVDLRKDVPSIALNKEQALHYMQKQAPELSGLAPGWHLVSYAGFPLGWIKSLGQRINNYYPTAWRIQRTIPDASFE